jgi:hypothetical protein
MEHSAPGFDTDEYNTILSLVSELKCNGSVAPSRSEIGLDTYLHFAGWKL